METTSLYNKYRPSNFSEIVGQESIVTILKNSIKENKVNHSYLFFGTRGTGKTTIARIFAKSLNCKNFDVTLLEPCNKCESCTSINSQNSMDVIEIDAASNNGVDEIRQLKEKTNYVLDSSHKIFIIDEIHMLSKSAFNAFLKLLEEPPKNVVFLLLTTEIYKIPKTILSRTIILEFVIPNSNVIIDNLKSILKNEEIEFEESALESIALLSKGSIRDSISILEKIIMYNNKKITQEDVNLLFGLIEKEKLDEIIFSQNYYELINLINENKNNIKNFINFFISHFVELITKNQVSKSNNFVKILDELIETIFKTQDPQLLFSKFISLLISNNWNEKNKDESIFVKQINVENKESKSSIETEKNNFSNQLLKEVLVPKEKLNKVKLNSSLNKSSDSDSNLINKYFIQEEYSKVIKKEHFFKLILSSIQEKNDYELYKSFFKTIYAYKMEPKYSRYIRIIENSKFILKFQNIALISFDNDSDYNDFKEIAFENNFLSLSFELFGEEVVILGITEQAYNASKSFVINAVENNNISSFENISFDFILKDHKLEEEKRLQSISKFFGVDIEVIDE